MCLKSVSAPVSKATVGLFGARGFVGREIISILNRHESLRLSRAWSTSKAGEPVQGCESDRGARPRFEALDLGALGDVSTDVIILALPNGQAAEASAALEGSKNPPSVVIDLSADARFDPGWTYGLPETSRSAIERANRIANPGCYATAMNLALAPIRESLSGAAHCFGISGFSGAGRTPNERNNQTLLAGGVMPYASVGHVHEQEVSHHLDHPVRLAPAVAPFKRGIVLTALVELRSPTTSQTLIKLYDRFYAGENLISVIGPETPRVQTIVGHPGAIIGGIQVDLRYPTRAAVTCVIDNLLKGAASQAIQNVNLALGFSELEGIRT